MERTIAKYLARHAVDAAWARNWGAPAPSLNRAVVIPACAEEDTLPQTLKDLEAAAAHGGGDTAVLVVVNQHDAAPVAWREENLRTLAWLRDYRGPLHLAWADCAAPGSELPAKQGVGLARRIGLDQGLRLLAEDSAALLFCLDADTRVPPEYLVRTEAAFDAAPSPAGAALAYAHPLEGQGAAGICAYETYLRYHAIGLRYAGSPYAFPTIGSAMAVTAGAYAAISGMPKRAAAEDFYFMQKLAKHGPLLRVLSTHVSPSSRPSARVPFGTGAQVAKYADAPAGVEQVYHPAVYGVLRRWLASVPQAIAGGGVEAFDLAAQHLHPALADWLSQAHFARDWERIAANTRPESRLTAFHRWMDGFRTLKLIHHLRAAAFPSVPMAQAVPELVCQIDAVHGETWAADLPAVPSVAALEQLRRMDRHMAADSAWDPPGGPLGIGLSAGFSLA